MHQQHLLNLLSVLVSSALEVLLQVLRGPESRDLRLNLTLRGTGPAPFIVHKGSRKVQVDAVDRVPVTHVDDDSLVFVNVEPEASYRRDVGRRDHRTPKKRDAVTQRRPGVAELEAVGGREGFNGECSQVQFNTSLTSFASGLDLLQYVVFTSNAKFERVQFSIQHRFNLYGTDMDGPTALGREQLRYLLREHDLPIRLCLFACRLTRTVAPRLRVQRLSHKEERLSTAHEIRSTGHDGMSLPLIRKPSLFAGDRDPRCKF